MAGWIARMDLQRKLTRAGSWGNPADNQGYCRSWRADNAAEIPPHTTLRRVSSSSLSKRRVLISWVQYSASHADLTGSSFVSTTSVLTCLGGYSRRPGSSSGVPGGLGRSSTVDKSPSSCGSRGFPCRGRFCHCHMRIVCW